MWVRWTRTSKPCTRCRTYTDEVAKCKSERPPHGAASFVGGLSPLARWMSGVGSLGARGCGVPKLYPYLSGSHRTRPRARSVMQSTDPQAVVSDPMRAGQRVRWQERRLLRSFQAGRDRHGNPAGGTPQANRDLGRPSTGPHQPVSGACCSVTVPSDWIKASSGARLRASVA